MKYIKSFDGIRGFGMLMVIIFHPGYLLGVWPVIQLFFALSGYLITNILLEDRDSPFRAYMARYYWRRTLRIFPLYFGVLFAVTIAYAIFRQPASFREDWIWLYTYTVNFSRARAGDVGEFFVHFWSLAVEEQFYFIWPLAIYFLKPQALKKVIITVILTAPLVRYATYQYFGGGTDVEHTILAGRMIYGLPFTQFDSFAVGAAIAVWKLERLPNMGRWFAVTIGVVGALGVVMLFVDHLWGRGANPLTFGYPMFMIEHGQYLWGYSLLNILAGVVLICSVQRLWLARVLFEWKPFIRLGQISYGCYIYHLPIMRLTEMGMASAGYPVNTPLRHVVFFTVYAGTTIAIAELSFRYFEKPFLLLKDRFQRRHETGETVLHQRSVA